MRKNNYLQMKIFTFYSIIIVTIVVLSFGAFYIYNYNNLKKSAISNLSSLTHMTSSQLDTLFEDMDKIALQIIANPTILHAFSRAKQWDKNSNYFEEHIDSRLQVVSTLTSINGPNIFASRINIFDNQGNFINMHVYPDSSPYTRRRLRAADFLDWYDGIIKLDGNPKILPPQGDSWSSQKDRILFSLVRELRDLNFSYGIIEIQIPQKKLNNIIKDYKGSNSFSVYLLTPENKLAYPYYSEAPEDIDQYLAHYRNAIDRSYKNDITITNPDTGEKEILVYGTSNFSGWTLIGVQPIKELLAPTRVMGIILIVVVICLIASALLLIFFVTKHMTKPLKDLRQAVNDVNLPNMTIDITHTHYNNELKLLHDAFLHMFKRLEASMDEVVQLKTKEMRAHMLALQSQMNPHFLYNALAVISASGMDEDYKKVCGMCEKLSHMLRYTSHFSDQLVPIGDEIIHATNYLELMKERFESGLTYTITTRGSLQDIYVPKLILQPLIENCFKHGFQNMRPPWVIELVLTVEGQHWTMEVSDNGSGFDEDKLRQIHERLEACRDASDYIDELHIGGLALLNTLLRIKFLYKEHMLFDIATNSQGTLIKIGGLIND